MNDVSLPGGGDRPGVVALPRDRGALAPDSAVLTRIRSLTEEGRELWRRFDGEVRAGGRAGLVPVDYERAFRTLLALREPGRRFLEWGCATGVITVMADLLGFEACGIEANAELVTVARELARKHGSGARFARGGYVPPDYARRSVDAGERPVTLDSARPAYGDLGHELADFDVVWAYPSAGEEAVMCEIMRRYGRRDGCLVLHGPRGDRQVRGREDRG